MKKYGIILYGTLGAFTSLAAQQPIGTLISATNAHPTATITKGTTNIKRPYQDDISLSGNADRYQIYEFAHTGRSKALQNLLAQGVDIDMSDDQGNSALCEAVWREDAGAFYLLKEQGASLNHPCIAAIPNEQRIIFNEIARLYLQEVSVLTAQDPAATENIFSDNALWTAGALVLAGTGAALASGSGGSGDIDFSQVGAAPRNDNPEDFDTLEYAADGHYWYYENDPNAEFSLNFLDTIHANKAYARGYMGYMVDRNSDGTLTQNLYQTDENGKKKIKIGVMDFYLDTNHTDLKSNIKQSINYDYGPCLDTDNKKNCYNLEGNRLLFYDENSDGTVLYSGLWVSEYYEDYVSAYGSNYVYDATDVAPPNSSEYHGTHVTGIIAALKNNSGMHGVVPNADIYFSNIASRSDISWGYEYKKAMENYVNQNVRVANLSFHVPLSYDADDQSLYPEEYETRIEEEGTYVYIPLSTMQGKDISDLGWLTDSYYLDMYKMAARNNIVIVQSAGNSGSDLDANWEAGLPLTNDFNGSVAGQSLENLYLTVVAVDNSSGKWALSPFSQICGAASSYCIAAPGYAYSTMPNNQYDSKRGTSMAAPVVTGSVALLMSAFPNLTSQQVVYLLLNTAQDINDGIYTPGTDDYKNIYGVGMVDLDKATQPYGYLSTSLSALSTNGLTGTTTAATTVRQNSVNLPQTLRSQMLSDLPQTFVAFDSLNRPYDIPTSVLFTDTVHHKTRIFKNDFRAFRHQHRQQINAPNEQTQFAFTDSILPHSSSIPYGNFSFSYETHNAFKLGFAYAENTLYMGDYNLQSTANPFLKMKEAYQMNGDWQITKKLGLNFSYTTGRNGFYENEDDDNDMYDNRMQMFSSRLSYSLKNNLQIGFIGGMLNEDNSLLGMMGTDAFGIQTGQTTFAGISMTYQPIEDLSLTAAYYRGFTKAKTTGSALSFSRLQSESIAFNGAYTFGPHKVGVDISSPLRFVKGHADMTLASGRHPTEDVIYQNHFTTSVKPSAREWIFSLFYNRELSKLLAFQTKIGVRLHPDHDRTAAPDYFGLFNLDWMY